MPSGAVMVPLLATSRAISATSPPSAPMEPALVTVALEVPEKVLSPPFRNAASGRSRVEAVKDPPVRTFPVGPTATPAGLTRYTDPVAVREPSMRDGMLPVTRFSVAPPPLLMATLFPLPMEKLSQLMTALREAWSMMTLVPEGVAMDTAPAETDGPDGRDCAAPGAAALAIRATLVISPRGSLAGDRPFRDRLEERSSAFQDAGAEGAPWCATAFGMLAVPARHVIPLTPPPMSLHVAGLRRHERPRAERRDDAGGPRKRLQRVAPGHPVVIDHTGGNRWWGTP